MIDRRAINEYLSFIGEKKLPLNLFEIVDIEDRFAIERVKELLKERSYINDTVTGIFYFIYFLKKYLTFPLVDSL